MRMRKYYPVAVLLILLAAIALSASLVTTNANALPTFTTAVGGIGPCASCHTMTATHAVKNHTTLACSSCHLSSTATPPTPVACAACHGPTSDHLAFILASATHVTTKCGTTAGCHVAPSPTPTATPTATPTPTPTVMPKVTLKLSGLKSGAMKLGKRVTATGKVTPTSLAGSKVRLTVQKKRGARWVTVKSVARTISASGAYSWKYKPRQEGRLPHAGHGQDRGPSGERAFR